MVYLQLCTRYTFYTVHPSQTSPQPTLRATAPRLSRCDSSLTQQSMPSTPSNKTTVSPTRISPEGNEALDLPRGCKLEVEWDGKVPRLLLKKGNKHELQWPLAEMTRIEVCHDPHVCEPCLRFTLGSNVEHLLAKQPADPELLDAYQHGALRRGSKILYMTAGDAKSLYTALREHKDAGLPCLTDVCCEAICEPAAPRQATAGDEDNVAALGLLSLGDAEASNFSPPTVSHRVSSMASSIASAITAASLVFSPTVRETLIFVCSPPKSKLDQAKDEAIDVANEVQRCASSTQHPI